MAALGLRRCAQAFSSGGELRRSLAVVLALLTAAASLAEPGLPPRGPGGRSMGGGSCRRALGHRLGGCGPQAWLRAPDGSVGKESACNAGDPGSIPGSGRSA